MRIGLDGLALAEIKTGVGHYTFELANALASVAPQDEFSLISPLPYLDTRDDAIEQPLQPNLRLTEAKVNRFSRRRWWAIGLPLYLQRTRLDLFHGTNYDVPLWNRLPTVATIHDLSIFLYPEMHEQEVVRRARRLMPTMARRATMIITPSESVKREVCEWLKIEPDKVTAIPHAARRTFRPATTAETAGVSGRLQLADNFILYVGTIEPRKNLLMLVRALEEIYRATDLRPQLVITGKVGWLTEEFFSYLKDVDIRERVHFTGYLSDSDLRAVYSLCGVFVYPSSYEGFGLPLLEAMVCGAPVITSRIESLIETAGNAACLVPPGDFRELAQSIVTVLTNSGERNRLSQAGLQRAREFSWESTAAETLKTYRKALKKKEG
jgi:glycosyltransferase involved in cell wall biosynthesis